MGNLIIRGGLLVDGTGSPPFEADVVIEGDKIADVIRRNPTPPDLTGETDAEIIDASGRLVMPGFVDVHSHSDINILIDPSGASKIRQGITTEIVGNCGYSAFPLAGPILEEEREAHAKYGFDIDWTDVDGYFSRLEAARPAFNLATFVGHGNVRGAVLGYEDRPATRSEMQAMEREVERAVEAGALGLSTGLIYAPGLFASTEELVELQKAAARRGGIYTSHVRGEGDTLLEAANEFFAVVENAACQGQFSHLKASGPRNWGKVKRVIEQAEQTNARGGRVRFDKYPYIASSTQLASLLPRWACDGGRDRTIERLQDPQLRGRIIREAAEHNEGRDGWASVLICEAGAPEFEKYQGLSIADAARDAGLDAGEMFAELLVRGRLTTSICNFTMSQEDTDLALLHPLGMVCTDAGCRAPHGPLSNDTPHPRAYGSFAKFFRDYVKERPLMTLESAVAKVTALPCDTFGLRGRGLVQVGYQADLLVIDWARFEDRSVFTSPHQFCDGLDAVVVNGVPTVVNGRETGQRGGRLLQRGRDALV